MPVPMVIPGTYTVAEVSNTTLSFDLAVKAKLFARAEIPEYCVVDIEGRRLIVHWRPADGVYGEPESIATLAAPEHATRVGDLF